MKKITLAIVTYKRPQILRKCFESIVAQTLLPTMVFIIDNDPQKSARSLIKLFKPKLNLSYTFVGEKNTAIARNKALNICTTPLLGFVDDDCMLQKNWVKQALSTIANKNNSPDYVIGFSKLSNPQSALARAQYYHHQYWFDWKLKKNNNVPTPFNFDTKNIIIKTDSFRKNHLKFNPKFMLNSVDASDTEMGFQASTTNLKGKFNPKMIVYHKEQENLLVAVLHKAYLKGKLASDLAQKWDLTNEFIDPHLIPILNYIKSIRLWKKEFNQYTSLYNHPMIGKLYSFLILKLYERLFLKGYLDRTEESGYKIIKP